MDDLDRRYHEAIENVKSAYFELMGCYTFENVEKHKKAANKQWAIIDEYRSFGREPPGNPKNE